MNEPRKRKQSDNSKPGGAWVRCLGCDKHFFADSRFNRTCWECKMLVSWAGEQRKVEIKKEHGPMPEHEHKESNGFMCYAPDCRNQSHCKGLCRAHYILKWRTGGLERPERRNKKDPSKINLLSADLFADHAKKCYSNVVGADRMMYWRAEMRKAERMIKQGAPCHEDPDARTSNAQG